MADCFLRKTVEEMTPFSKYQQHGKYYELSLCFLVLLQTLRNVFGPCVSLFVAIIERARLTGYLFTLRSRGAYLSVASVYNGAYQSHTRDTKRSIEGAKTGWDREAIDTCILTASEA